MGYEIEVNSTDYYNLIVTQKIYYTYLCCTYKIFL